VQRSSPGQGGNVEGDLYVSSDATPAGQQAECAHQTKGTDTFKACSHATANWLSVNGPYSLSLCLPTQVIGARITPKVIDEGSVDAPAVVPRAGANGCWSIAFTIAAPNGTRVVVAKRIVLVSTRPPPLQHVRLRFDKLLVRRAMDPSCPPDKPNCPYANESTLLGQIVTAPGEWQLYWSVNGIWGRWPGTLAANDGSVFRGSQSVDFYVARGKPWTLVTLARECDFGALPGWDGPGKPTLPCPASSEVGNSSGDDYPGAIAVTNKGLALGTHAVNASTAGSTCPTSNVKGCYQLTYTVSQVR
jgi:hypothetical protein